MKNVIKRAGIIFILGPIFIFCIIINAIICGLVIIWGPIYYIITGNDPLNLDAFSWILKTTNWYLKNFGPE